MTQDLRLMLVTVFFYSYANLRDLPSFPTRRSSDLSVPADAKDPNVAQLRAHPVDHDVAIRFDQDRKSTRLNSSHGYILYAVFCLKKEIDGVLVELRYRHHTRAGLPSQHIEDTRHLA